MRETDTMYGKAAGITAGISVAASLVFPVTTDEFHVNIPSETSRSIIGTRYCQTVDIINEPVDNDIIEKWFANPEFVKHYEEFGKELMDNIEREFEAGNVNPIKYYRIKRDMTQFDLAKMTGVTQPRISRWESVRHPKISVHYLKELAQALEVSMEELTA